MPVRWLDAAGLPQRWQGRQRFVLFTTGFGLGEAFLAAWQAWRDDAQRCAQLVVVALEPKPAAREALARAHADSRKAELAAALVAAWPPLSANLHTLDFEGGRVQLLLAVGDPGTLLPRLRFEADTFFLNAAVADRGGGQWSTQALKTLGRRAAAGAMLCAAPSAALSGLREGLTTAGFQLEDSPLAQAAAHDGLALCARYQPRHTPQPLPGPRHEDRSPRRALVIGAGIAGAAAADALRRAGLSVVVLERGASAAAGASGNPAGLVHGTVNPDDGPYARLFRAAALQAARRYGAGLAEGQAEGEFQGLLRMDPRPDALPRLEQAIAATGLPADYVQALDAPAASALAGLPLASAAWFYPQGGWLAPATWIASTLAQDGITLRCHATVARLRATEPPSGRCWQALDAQGSVLEEAEVVVVACSASSARLLRPWLDGGAAGDPETPPTPPPWPLRATRGQISLVGMPGTLPRLPLAGDGYALRLGDGPLLCGATRHGAPAEAVDTDPGLREEDHAHNRERAQRLTGLNLPPAEAWQGRAGWRLHTDDRLPIAGAVPARTPSTDPRSRRDQARLLAREPGLFVLTALGARGLTLAPLLGRLVAAQATGAPWPLEQDLADAVDPARWQVRAVRTGSPAGPARGLEGVPGERDDD